MAGFHRQEETTSSSPGRVGAPYPLPPGHPDGTAVSLLGQGQSCSTPAQKKSGSVGKKT